MGGNDIGQGGFTGTGWPPEYHGRNSSLFNDGSQDTSLTHQVFLADHFIQGMWPDPLGQRYMLVHAPKLIKKRSSPVSLHVY